MKYLLPVCLLIACLVGCHKQEVQPRPTADFTYSVISSTNVEKVYQFVNTSKNADRFQWSTPTGVATTDKNLLLRVTQNGRNLVSLTAKNDVGEDTKTENIDVTDLATTGNVVFWMQFGDKGDVSVSVNDVYQGKLTRYVNNGVAPSCGREGFVTVTLHPGSYLYSAKSEGLFPLKWSGTFNVVRGQCSTWELRK